MRRPRGEPRSLWAMRPVAALPSGTCFHRHIPSGRFEGAGLATIAAPRQEQRHEGLSAARARATMVNRVLTVVTFAAIYLVLVKVMHLNLILSRTTAAGGDMGSHHYIDTFLRTDLLPHHRITGWAPGWFAGLPMLTFYFPLPYLSIAALTPLLGNQIAFKLVTAGGPFLLPLTCWAAFKVLRLREPAPLLAACGSVVFLMMKQIGPAEADQFNIWGGNIASTMAGEFSFALSFALLPLLLIFGVAFCLTAFWGLPFILRQSYTAHMKWDQLTNYTYLLPSPIRPYLILTAIGLVAAIARGERRILLFAWPAMLAAFAYVTLPHVIPAGAIWNARMLPLIYLCELLVAAYGAAVIIGRVTELLRRWSAMPVRIGCVVVVLALALTPIISAYRTRGDVPGWTEYNYSGFEVKPDWPQAVALFHTLDRLPHGRVMWEFSRDYERMGTTRTLENIPAFSTQDSMEGLLIESSLNAPFHFINQAETSQTATQAVPGIQYPGFDFKTGLEHLRMFGVRWYVAYTDQTKEAANQAGTRSPRPAATS